MARFVSQGDNEPLMRLERPSTASSQTTAHVINSCFNEILSQKQLGSKDISNLVVSKREKSDSVYQDYYVDKLTKIAEKSKQRLDELAQVERHLMQARAKALAEDEKNLAILVSSCPSYKTIGLPQGPSQFHKYLNEELLAQHNLLLPSHYFPQHTADSSFQGDYLTVSEATDTHTTRHVTLPLLTRSEEALASILTQKVPRPSWCDSLTASERQSEKQFLSQLDRKTAFLKNPKFSKDVNNTASFGPLKKRLQNVEQQESRPPDFLIEPKEVVFTVYRPGDRLQCAVVIKNVSAVSRYLRLIAVKSDYFSVSPGKFPNEDGLVAPGMQGSFDVTFHPDSLANYKENMRIMTSSGECLKVPLIGMRSSPELSLPSVLDCGGCLAGDNKPWSIRCVNFGGEGSFKLLLTGEPVSEAQEGDPCSIAVGPFLVTPKEFSISAEGGNTELNVQFTPPGIGKFTKELEVACDNGQVLTYTLTGTGEKVRIGCTVIRSSTVEEINSFESTPSGIQEVSLSCTQQYEELDTPLDVITRPCLVCEAVNPQDCSFKTVVIHNFSDVNIPFVWMNYRPLTECDEEDTDISRTPSEGSPFAISPSSGTIGAKQAATFVVCFRPEMLGSFVDMGYMVLTGHISDEATEASTQGAEWIRLPDSRVAMICLQMEGACQPFVIEISPPACIIPGHIPISTVLKKKFKIINHSTSSVYYQWSSFEGDGVSITVDPDCGRIVSGGSCWCEVAVLGHTEGTFASTLHCSLKHCAITFPLHICGDVQGPVVSLDCGILDFSLIPFGRSSSLDVRISNTSNASVSYCFTQLIQNRDQGFMDHQCLSFSPGEGELSPHSSSSITVQCCPQQNGRLRSVAQLLVNGKTNRFISVEAEVHRPGLCLNSCHVHMEEVYVGIPRTHNMLLKNCSLIPSHFTWSSQVCGSDNKNCKVDVKLMNGRVGPREEMVVPVDVTWTAEGSFNEVILKCDVLDMESPIFASFSADVKGLSVVYKLLSTNDSDEGDPSEDGIPLPTIESGEYLLDFGRENRLGQPTSMVLQVANISAIPTSIKAAISHFVAADVPDHATLNYRNSSDKNTNLIIRSGSKTREQDIAEYISGLLRHDQGVCFVVDPSSAELPAFGCINLRITVYSNMWGDYSDQLTCNVDGLSSMAISIKAGFVGCPIEFQSTATLCRTLIRFGTHSIGASPTKRVMKLKNLSPCALRVDWNMFDIIIDDEKIVNLVTTFGDPFPKAGNILASKLYNEEIATCGKSSLSSSRMSHGRMSQANSSISHGYGNGGGESVMGEEEAVIRVHLEPHEGQKANTTSPFTILPKQTVLPSHGKVTVEVAFTPSSEALKTLGMDPCAYALGYISIDEPDSPHVVRDSGFDVEPLRVDLMAGIEQPRFLLEFDEDHGLHFECPASLLLRGNNEIKSEGSWQHKFTLINPTSSTQYFDFCTASSHFFVADVQAGSGNSRESSTAVKPRGTIQFSVKFSFTPNDIVGNTSESHFEGMLQLKFSVGIVQEFLLSAVVKLPELTLSEDFLEMGTVHLEKSSTSSFTISNLSVSRAVWTTEISHELADVINVTPQLGVLNAHLHRGRLSRKQVEVTFSPKCEGLYDGSLVLKELLTGQVLSLRLTGRGSADEHHSK